jgi:hypothetical protein
VLPSAFLSILYYVTGWIQEIAEGDLCWLLFITWTATWVLTRSWELMKTVLLLEHTPRSLLRPNVKFQKRTRHYMIRCSKIHNHRRVSWARHAIKGKVPKNLPAVPSPAPPWLPPITPEADRFRVSYLNLPKAVRKPWLKARVAYQAYPTTTPSRMKTG